MQRFAGKVVMITGAAGGIGQTLCRHFGAEGAAIAALDRRGEVDGFVQKLAADGIDSVAATADIGEADQVEAAVDRFVQRFGRIDVLVNNAGVSAHGSLSRSSAESWRDDVNSNLNGAFNCSHCALPQMQAAGGVIVNIGSVNGLMALGDPAYSAGKAGLISLTRSLAMEYGKFNIRVNIVCPGTVRTPIWEQRLKRNPEIFAELVKWYPLRRVADPIDIAKVVAFLASDDAGAITGAVLPVDCGLTAGNIVMSRELTLEDF